MGFNIIKIINLFFTLSALFLSFVLSLFPFLSYLELNNRKLIFFDGTYKIFNTIHDNLVSTRTPNYWDFIPKEMAFILVIGASFLVIAGFLRSFYKNRDAMTVGNFLSFFGGILGLYGVLRFI